MNEKGLAPSTIPDEASASVFIPLLARPLPPPCFMLTTQRRRTPCGPRLVTVGQCSTCGVAFAGRHADRELVTHVLGVHERICPGGNRTGEVARPVEALRTV